VRTCVRAPIISPDYARRRKGSLLSWSYLFSASDEQYSTRLGNLSLFRLFLNSALPGVSPAFPQHNLLFRPRVGFRTSLFFPFRSLLRARAGLPTYRWSQTQQLSHAILDHQTNTMGAVRCTRLSLPPFLPTGRRESLRRRIPPPAPRVLLSSEATHSTPMFFSFPSFLDAAALIQLTFADHCWILLSPLFVSKPFCSFFLCL